MLGTIAVQGARTGNKHESPLPALIAKRNGECTFTLRKTVLLIFYLIQLSYSHLILRLSKTNMLNNLTMFFSLFGLRNVLYDPLVSTRKYFLWV